MATLGASVGLAAVFVVAFAGAIVVHLGLPPARRTVRQFVNPLLGSLFQGKLEVGEIDRLGLQGLTVRSVDAYDPGGARVIHVAGLKVDADIPGIVKSALGSGDILIKVPLIHLDDVDVALVPGEGGAPTIAGTFLPRTKSTEPPKPGGGRGVRVALDRIEIAHVGAHGAVAPSAPIDAELSGTLASVQVGPSGVVVDVPRNHLVARAPVPRPLEADVSYRLEVGKDGLKMDSGIDGTFGGVEVHVKGASMHGDHVHARVEVPRVTGEQIAGLIPATPPPKIPLRVPVGVVVEADGDLPRIGFKTTVSPEGGGSVETKGQFDVASPQTLDAEITISKFDPRVILEVPSAAPLDAHGHVHLALGAEPKIDADVSTQPFALSGQPIPGVDAKASLVNGTWSGKASVHEKGAPVDASFTFAPKDGLHFDVDARVASLRAVSRLKLPPGVEASARVRVKGSLRDGKLDASVSGNYGGVQAPGQVEVGGGTIEGSVRGPLKALEVDATVKAQDVRAGKYAWSDATVHAHGPVTAPKISAELTGKNGDSITVDGGVDAAQKAVTGLSLWVRHNGQSIKGNVARVAASPGGVKIEGIRISGDGIGGLSGGLRVVGKELVGSLHGQDVDVAKLAQMAGVKDPVGGVANVDIDLSSARPGQRKGHVAIEVVGGEVGKQVSGLSGVFTATFDGDEVHSDGLFRLISHADEHEPPKEQCDGAIAQLRITGGEGEIPGPLLDPATWRKVAGKVELAADDWNLRCLAKRVPGLTLYLSEVHGKLTTRATIERKPGARFPSVTEFLAKTAGLRIIGPKGLLSERPEWDSLRTDVEVRGRFDADAGVAGGVVRLEDEADPDNKEIGEAAVGATLDLPTLLDHPEQRDALLRRTPLTGRVEIKRRKITGFSALPSFIRDRIPALAGEVAVGGSLKGTIVEPHANLEVRAWGLAQATMASSNEPTYGTWGLPIDLDTKLAYDGKRASLDLTVDHADSRILDAKARIDLPIADALAGRVQPKGGLTVDMTSMPLGKIPFFEERAIKGHVSGNVTLKGLGEQPTLSVDIKSPDLQVGHNLVYDTSINMRVDDTQVADVDPKDKKAGTGVRSASSLHVDFVSKTGGELHTTVTNAIAWVGGMVPRVDPKRAADLRVQAKSFHIAIAAPFVPTAVVSRLDGVLDGDASVHFDRVEHASSDDPDDQKGIAIDAGMKLSDVVLNIPKLGQELHDTGIAVTGKDGKLKFENIRAEGAKGLLTGEGSMSFVGLVPHEGKFTFRIAKGQEIPLTLEGAPLGDASGELSVAYARKPREMDVDISVPRLHIDLPAALGRDVQKLDPNPDVHIDGALADNGPEAPPTGSLPMKVTVKELNVELAGNTGAVQLDLAVTGSKKPPLEVDLVGAETRVKGALYLTPGGKLNALKKDFEVDHGVVTMREEDPGNPYVNVKLHWDSPEGRIYVEYIGTVSPLSDDKIKFSGDGMSADHAKTVLLTGGPTRASPRRPRARRARGWRPRSSPPSSTPRSGTASPPTWARATTARSRPGSSTRWARR